MRCVLDLNVAPTPETLAEILLQLAAHVNGKPDAWSLPNMEIKDDQGQQRGTWTIERN